ncbi:MAG: hypothetical protein BECKG1743D_GA0114223_102992 [Candidatus Kentron sp. G]|nr:MAG: hypothetical protein BECKG1743F_GA0114225_102732 [Candidatus Kentron sp. G]VFM99956.1 MAG: hypothetical protein BECKG1743E_GA0114224_102942 [Candidatus Kentron sp. G]VFN01655.1 MAG: hypothetical protein BECKG1743D_GA0114223_102992 [Candidatus Kentron sp. G]
MKIFIICLGILLLAVAGMAIGILFGGPRGCSQGSCAGGANMPGMEGGCSACGSGAAPEDKERA